MEFSSAIYRGDPCPEFSFSFKYLKAVKYIFNSRMRDRNNMKEA